jgi:D-sedoheptulose 7-phosphate isomerase
MNDLIHTYLGELAQVVMEMDALQIEAVVGELLRAQAEGAQVFLLGNGGSASTASHMCNDLNKFTISPGCPRFRAIALTDNVASMTAWGNDSAYEDIFVEQMFNFVHPGDMVIGLSTSGNSPNVLKALYAAKEMGATTIGFTGRQGGQLREIVDICVLVPSDHIGIQEDCHLILNHVIVNTLRAVTLARSMALQSRWGEEVSSASVPAIPVGS